MTFYPRPCSHCLGIAEPRGISPSVLQPCIQEKSYSITPRIAKLPQIVGYDKLAKAFEFSNLDLLFLPWHLGSSHFRTLCVMIKSRTSLEFSNLALSIVCLVAIFFCDHDNHFMTFLSTKSGMMAQDYLGISWYSSFSTF